MLSPSELTSLYNIISDDTKSFELIASNFQKTYSKIDQFKVGVTLWFLVKDNLLNLSQRLASFYILYDMYRNEKVATTPFIPIVLETLQTSTNKVEQRLLINFIENNINYQKTVVKTFKEDIMKTNDTIEMPDLQPYWNAHYIATGKQGNEINDWIRPVIYDKGDNEKKKEEDIDNMPMFNLSHLSQEEVTFNFFEPNYLTYYPNSNYPFLEDEPMWIIPTLKYDFIWDFTMSPEQDSLSAILNKPLNNKPITDEQITYALEIIGNNPNILKEIHFTPESLMKMVDKKDQFASDILLKISKHVIFQDYLTPFVINGFNSNAMKVLSKVIQYVEIPKVFINSYIKHIINTFKIETRKDTKTQIARKLAFFITNLIKYEHITKETFILPEIEELFTVSNEEVDALKKKLIELKQKDK